MSAFNLRKSAASSRLRASVALPRWRHREVAISAVMAITSLFIACTAWRMPMSLPSRLLDTAAACGGLAAALAPRLLFLPAALRDARGSGLLVPQSALRMAAVGRLLLLAAAACWLRSMLSS